MDARLFYIEDAPTPHALEELSDVSLTVETEVPRKGKLPCGARGTIVAVHGSGEAYDVEFAQPFHALLLLKAEAVVPIRGATRDRLIAETGDVRD